MTTREYVNTRPTSEDRRRPKGGGLDDNSNNEDDDGYTMYDATPTIEVREGFRYNLCFSARREATHPRRLCISEKACQRDNLSRREVYVSMHRGEQGTIERDERIRGGEGGNS